VASASAFACLLFIALGSKLQPKIFSLLSSQDQVAPAYRFDNMKPLLGPNEVMIIVKFSLLSSSFSSSCRSSSSKQQQSQLPPNFSSGQQRISIT